MFSLRKSLEFSTKQSLVEKDNNFILVVLSVTSFIVVFCLVGSNALYKRISYQDKVINARTTADNQLKANINSSTSLQCAYNSFEAQTPVVTGVSKNSIMVLDALPSKYDFPALVTSLSKLMAISGLSVQTINGIDAEVSAVQSSPDPKVVPINFQLTGNGSYSAVSTFISNLEKSIRPITISNITFSGSDAKLTVTIKATTYYQPEKIFKITQNVISPSGAVK